MNALYKLAYPSCLLLIISVVHTTAQIGSSNCIPTLLQPEHEAVLDNGCDFVSDEGTWFFDWENCEGATKYNLYVKGFEASYPAINNDSLTISEFTSIGSGYIVDRNRLDWRWKVRAYIDDQWGPWSDERRFDIEPLNTDCKDMCVVRLTKPYDGKEIDNGCHDKSDIMSWSFDWTACEGDTKYHLQVRNEKQDILLIDNDSIESAIYEYNVYDFIPEAYQMGWKWKVRAYYKDKWDPWSEEFNFWVETPNADCPVTGIFTSADSNNIISLYPNPAKDYVYLQFPSINQPISNIEMDVFSVDGKNRLSLNSLNLRKDQKIVDISTLSPGLYIIEIKMDDIREKHKMLVLDR